MAEQQAESIKNCVECKKAIRRVRRYYRNGKYYCNKNCWRSSRPKSAAKPEES